MTNPPPHPDPDPDGDPGDLDDCAPAGWIVVACPRCAHPLELTSLDPTHIGIAVALHQMGGCRTRTRTPAGQPLPVLPADTHTVRLVDHHGRLIEQISPDTYEALRPVVDRTRAGGRDQPGQAA